ncbi:hypothetical protein, partial [Beijerinckia sp. L45]|uniref:hypothetical protein n=1 Tax=Beijerinckia sp. L45 TaxID=1641855 RepID=UPI001AED4123
PAEGVRVGGHPGVAGNPGRFHGRLRAIVGCVHNQAQPCLASLTLGHRKHVVFNIETALSPCIFLAERLYQEGT